MPPSLSEPSYTIHGATTEEDMDDIRALFTAYTDWLDMDLTFQNYAQELASLPGAYAPYDGALLLARDNEHGTPLGCVALRPLPNACCPAPVGKPIDESGNDGPSQTHKTYESLQKQGTDDAKNQNTRMRYAEMKRLYVSPAGRGRGIGKALATEVVERARLELWYDYILLDALPMFKEALGVYRSLGFVACEKYYENPVEGALFLQLDLRGQGRRRRHLETRNC